MDDAINTTTWRQPNTFMDIIGPRTNNPAPRVKPEHSETLMRSAVTRPVPVVDEPTNQVTRITTSASRPDLTSAATLTDRSPLISHYSPANQDMSPEAAAVPVAAFPSMEAPAAAAPTIEESPMDASGEAVAVAAEQPGLNIFNNALKTPYEYSRPIAKSGSKWQAAKKLSGWSVLGIVVVGIIAGGIFVNSNLSKFEFYLASSRAGFSATLPAVRPSGYNLNGISTSAGAIEASFKSNSDSRNYTISEKTSSMSSGELLNSYLESKAGMNYQTISTSSNTIYVYDGHDATWVNNGIWYVVQDNNALSNHQIIDIANSM
jgi:hypothetical protein